jgi:quercetin dioxygenase-like cupin family protein
MLSKRRFLACALCAGGGVLTAEIGVRAQAPGFTRTVLNRTPGPGESLVTLQVLVEIDPNVLVARHTHPSIEEGYILEGGGVFGLKGAADRTVKAGDSFQAPFETPHLLQNGPAKTRVLSVYVVDKDKPLATPAPA